MLKLLLIFPLLLLSQDSFTLPDESSYFIATLNQGLLTAKKEVLISSSIINDYSFITTLKNISKKNIKIIIITQVQKVENKASSLDLLQNINLHRPKGSQAVLGSFICIDNSVLYLSSTNLDYKSLRSEHAFVIKDNRPCKDMFLKLLKKCDEG